MRLSFLIFLTLPVCLFAQAVKDREGALRADREKMTHQDRWIYDDPELAFKKAQQNHRPVLAVLRCVPCLGCSRLDSSFMQDETLTHLLDQYVCLRLIKVNSLDLKRFQFDYDLSLSAIVLNADGTTYGRFGSWAHQKDPQLEETEGLKAFLEGALRLHQDYPKNKVALSAKQPKQTPYRTPLEMPAIAQNPRAFTPDLDWQGKVVQSCLHCHQIGDAAKSQLHDSGRPLPLKISHPFPEPKAIGINLTLTHRAQISSVIEGSPADQAGLQTGDEILFANQSPLISSADLSWLLHHLSSSRLDLIIERKGQRIHTTLALPENWRLEADISRRVGTWPMRAWIGGGMKLQDLTDQEREQNGLSLTQLALRAEHVGQYAKHAAAKRQGFRKGDLIVQIGPYNQRLSESKLFALLLKDNDFKPVLLKAKVLRNGKEISLSFPIQ